MNWILLVMGAIVSVVAAVLIGGALIPASYAATRSLTLRADPPTVRAALRDLADWPVWMVLARTPLVSATGDDTTEVTLLNDEQQPVSTLRFVLAAHAGGTRVVATDTGAIGNPAVRLLRHYVSGHQGTVLAALQALADAVGEPAAPADA